MKEWHVVVLEGHKVLYDKIFFKVDEARQMEKDKKEEYDERLKKKEVRVLREYY